MSHSAVPNHSSPCYAIRVRAPSGTIYIVVSESEDNKPIQVQIHLGKTGSQIYAWATALADLITTLLSNGNSIEEVITHLSLNTSNTYRVNDNLVKITSDIEGVVYGLLRYKREKYKEFESSLGKGPHMGSIRRHV